MTAQTPANWPWLINRQWRDSVAADDRGFQYGDGLFETLRLIAGKPHLLERHIARLGHGLAVLRIDLHPAIVKAHIDHYVESIDLSAAGVLKLIVSRGLGSRGYRFEDSMRASIALKASSYQPPTLSQREQGVQLRLCTTRLACNPLLAGIKHLNRLEQVLARSEWTQPTVFDGLMLDVNDRMVEATMSNVFFVVNGVVHTPRLDQCGVAGVMREELLKTSLPEQGYAVREAHYAFTELQTADEVFISNSLIGVLPVTRCEHLSWPVGPTALRLQQRLGLLAVDGGLQ